MNKTMKWILGILIGLLVVAVIAALGWMVFSHWNQNEWVYGMRSGRLWDTTPLKEERSLQMPSDGFHGFRSPGSQLLPQFMPMHPGRAISGRWVGFFGPLRLFGGALLCLGLPALLIVGLVLLLTRKKISQPPPIPPTAPVQSAPDGLANSCASCSRQVQAEWTHCPFCGNKL